MASYWFEPTTVEFNIGGRTLSIETGRLAKQAAGAALVTYGETVVLVTAARANPRPGIDFFPLVVDFVEKTSAAGKVPGGFFKREGRLSEREVLVSRFIDRSIRPLFADGYRDETHIVATVLSADGECQPERRGQHAVEAAEPLGVARNIVEQDRLGFFDAFAVEHLDHGPHLLVPMGAIDFLQLAAFFHGCQKIA